MKTWVLIMVVALVVPQLVGGQTVWGPTTGDLLRMCEKESLGTLDTAKDYLAVIACSSYIGGFNDGNAYLKTTLWCMTCAQWCTPKGVTFLQFTRVFVKWAQNNPELLHEPKQAGLAKAFAAAWPCKAKK